MQIKVIAVGSTRWERFTRRWGVSFLIGEDVLFDSFGDPGVLLNNMRKFNIDAAKIKHIVLSHDDWDHISGLWYVLNKRKDITVYICPAFKQEIKDRITSFGVKIIETKEWALIKDGIYSTGQLCGGSEGRKIYEQSLVIESSCGISIVCGCAHTGVINIIDETRRHLKGNLYLILGGFHLKYTSPSEIKETISKLKLYEFKHIAPTHCTGKLATHLLRNEFPEKFIEIKPGSIVEI